jgi:hypothetical protein
VSDETSFSSSYEGIHEMLNMPEMFALMQSHADKVRALAEASAPVGSPAEPDSHSGRYKAGFHTAVFPDHGAKHDRPEGYVINDTPDAFWVEYGTAGREPYHTLHRAVTEAKP